MPRILPAIAMGLVPLFGLMPVAADTWTDYDEIGPDLLAHENTYPDLCKRDDLGLSYEGRHLWAVRISDNVLLDEDEPEFKYIATMHGDEIVGTKMCMMLIDWLLANYGTDPQATNIIDEVELWIVPLMNPDGYDRSPRTRNNAQGINLNRNFPNYGDPDTPDGRATETQVIMNWCFGRSFTVSANFHGGALVVNYPFDNTDSGSQYTPDNDLFMFISEEYSRYNRPMWSDPDPPYAYHGIINGVDWYTIWGGMQDWNYHFRGCNEVTIELSSTKQPSASEIPTFWNDNRRSMLAYIETCLIGVRGIVTDAGTAAPLAATITVVGRDHEVYTDPNVGDYHRMLMPGTYDLVFEADGYDPVPITNVVVDTGDATRLDVALSAPPQIVSPNGGETLPAGVETTVTWNGNPLPRFHVQHTANYGDVTVISDGFESGVLDPVYSTGGDADWFLDGNPANAHTGSYAARAGDIEHDQVSWMTRTIGGGALSFWYHVSSEAGYDYFDFYIDAVREIHASGDGSWTYYTTPLPPGSYTLKWEYSKDYALSSGSDTVWIDDFEITEDEATWTDIVALTDPGATSTPWVPSEPSAACKVRVRAYYDDGGYYGVWDESDDVFTVSAGLPCSPGDGDIDCDGDVDMADTTAMIGVLLGTISDPDIIDRADLDGSGTPDGRDIQYFVEAFLAK